MWSSRTATIARRRIRPLYCCLERNYGPSMVFRVGGIDIIVITNNGQAVDLSQFT